jgi:opacity protein-like surface antigen
MMKKGIVAIIFGMIVGSSLYAENYSEGKKFLGLEVGAAQIQGGVYLDILDPYSYDQFYEGSDVTYGLRFGAQNDKYRTMILFDYYDNTDEDQNLQMGLVTIDYYVMSQDAASFTIKPFIGINVGYMRYESTLVDDSDFVYGGQAGLVASISENIDIDLSYRYSLTWETEAMDHFGAAMLGLNYLY